jgi:hypothetical protein
MPTVTSLDACASCALSFQPWDDCSAASVHPSTVSWEAWKKRLIARRLVIIAFFVVRRRRQRDMPRQMISPFSMLQQRIWFKDRIRFSNGNSLATPGSNVECSPCRLVPLIPSYTAWYLRTGITLGVSNNDWDEP